jgi:hypothetical protein
MSYETEGFDEFIDNAEELVKDWKYKKEFLLRRLARIYQREVKKLTPRDTSNLVNKINVGDPENDEIEVGTNVEYVIYVEEGHKQNARFVPGYWRETQGFQYIPYFEGGGMMLEDKFIEGAHMFKKGKNKSDKKWRREVKDFMREIERELNG